ncbi:hypothetical protein WJ970_30085 [Achromobacter xylosoxidans]
MVFLLQLAWLAPLAGALLSGMRSGARWLIALAAYVLVLPLLAAYGLGWDAKNMLAVVSDSQRPMLITFLIGAVTSCCCRWSRNSIRASLNGIIPRCSAPRGATRCTWRWPSACRSACSCCCGSPA